MLKFYFTPFSRSTGVHWLLEELGVSYEPVVIDIRQPGGVPESYRAIQPNKKVPAIDHDGTIVTERAAICQYLTEVFPQAGLAPLPGDAKRSAFLTWIVYCDSVFDPCLAAHAQNIEYRPQAFSFGAFDDMMANLDKQLTRHPFAIGDAFSAVDTQLASGIHFGINILKAMPATPVFEAYLGRCMTRPAFQRAMEREGAAAKDITPMSF
ncbi:MAG TPA: glutathione S-transferase family protein [Beijerinckiaceae bacterium]|jgi:glutathione S-transferase|nr:glutathione S-transferase family protein [Beijerinckiaceae bacterium]